VDVKSDDRISKCYKFRVHLLDVFNLFYAILVWMARMLRFSTLSSKLQ